jgi:hypothetical protein
MKRTSLVVDDVLPEEAVRVSAERTVRERAVAHD